MKPSITRLQPPTLRTLIGHLIGHLIGYFLYTDEKSLFQSTVFVNLVNVTLHAGMKASLHDCRRELSKVSSLQV